MIAALVTALTASIAYMVLSGCAPGLAGDLGYVYAAVIVAAWGVLAWKAGRR